jgi:hypothetical protein
MIHNDTPKKNCTITFDNNRHPWFLFSTYTWKVNARQWLKNQLPICIYKKGRITTFTLILFVSDNIWQIILQCCAKGIAMNMEKIDRMYGLQSIYIWRCTQYKTCAARVWLYIWNEQFTCTRCVSLCIIQCVCWYIVEDNDRQFCHHHVQHIEE